MASITWWNRIEAHATGADPGPGLEARVADPLWLLARQWQLGEFGASDGGTPVHTELELTRAGVTRFAAGMEVADWAPDAPLDVRIEHEQAEPDLRLRAHVGQELVRRLRAAGLDGAADHHLAVAPLAAEAGLLAGRVPDGAALRSVVAAELAAGPTGPLRTVLEEWAAWCDERIVPAPPSRAWRPDRLRQQFALGVPGGPLLVVDERRPGEPLEWFDFDADPDLDALGVTGEPATVTVEAAPRPVRYAGMPSTRFWQCEDGAVSLGDLSVAPEDLGRMLLIEFAIVGADDWLLVPVPAPVGTVQRITRLAVVDTFGTRVEIAPVPAADGWSMFRVEGEPVIVVPPTPGAELLGDPVEDLRLLRDEAANVGWGVERLVEDAEGRGTDAWPDPPPPPPPGDRLAYRLQTPIRPGWTPLIPREREPGVFELARGHLPGQAAVEPLSRVLAESDVLAEDAVPRDGLTIERRPHWARWTDGRAHLWTGRHVRPGGGEPASGLRFDALDDGERRP